MLRSFSYSLLITCFLLTTSCKTNFVPTSFDTQNISVSSNDNQLDSQVVQIYLPFKNDLEKDMGRVISISDKEMAKQRPESYLTNFLADMLLIEAKVEAETSNLNLTPTISYLNYGGIRTFLPEGKITVGNIFELMPFENEMVYLELSGTQIQEFLNHIADKGGDCIGGARFIISNEKAINIKIEGITLDLDKKYWLVTNDYVADGGDGLTVFTQRSELVKSGRKIRDIIIAHLEEKHKKGEILSVELDGRITNE
ncbi:MAG: hypothetical protein GQ525_02960 [Draconibacterium sp.]|nr:hypothetical protein [Draconibacterium sp.]